MSRRVRTCVLVSGCAWQAVAGTVYWNFDTEPPASNGVANVAAGPVSRGNGGTAALLTDTSVSGGYSGVSGGSNAVAAAGGGLLVVSASAYFQFTLTPGAGAVLRLNALSFGIRSTSTGPQAFCVRSSLDCYGSDVAGGTVMPDGNWALKSVSPLFQSSVPGEPVAFRIYGYNGTDKKAGNWRIDDLALSAVAVPQLPKRCVIFVK